MKKGYLIITIILMFSLFLLFVFADPDDVWKECTTDGTSEAVGETPYCCCSDSDYQQEWRQQSCPCISDCRNNRAESGAAWYPNEVCDWGLLGNSNGWTTASPPTVTCDDGSTGNREYKCKFDCDGWDSRDDCPPPVPCGNGVIDEGEVCDGSNLNGETCITQGFDFGTLSCSANCGSFDTSSCDILCTNDDNDGYYAESGCGTAVDCNDNDATIYPNAPELCDGKDNQCPGNAGYGSIDEGCTEPTTTTTTTSTTTTTIICLPGSISGKVQDYTNGEGILGARIDVIQGTTLKDTAYTDALGNYQINPDSCGTYDMIASADGYVSSTETNVELLSSTIIVDFTLVPGTTCEYDCTYVGDNTVHKECDGINGCDFCDARSKEVCDLAQPGWIRSYDENNVVECGEGCPYEKKEVKAKITCEEENLIKITKLVQYKGKLVKLVIVTCG